jgi:hypothetical protein
MVTEGLSIRLAKPGDLKAILALVRQHQRYDVEFAKRYYGMYFEGHKMVREDEVFAGSTRILSVLSDIVVIISQQTIATGSGGSWLTRRIRTIRSGPSY